MKEVLDRDQMEYAETGQTQAEVLRVLLGDNPTDMADLPEDQVEAIVEELRQDIQRPVIQDDFDSEQTLKAEDFSASEGTIQFGQFTVTLNCSVLTLPAVFQARKEEDQPVEIIELPEGERSREVESMVFDKPEEKMSSHLKPLYIQAHLDGVKVNRVMIDNGAAVNILPYHMLRKLGKSSDDLIHTDVTVSDFAGQA